MVEMREQFVPVMIQLMNRKGPVVRHQAFFFARLLRQRSAIDTDALDESLEARIGAQAVERWFGGKES